MKTITVFIAILALSVSSYCQDIIYLDNGDSIICEIVQVDTGKIYINMYTNDREISTFVNREKIRDYKYDAFKLKPIDFHFTATLAPLNFLVLGPTVTGDITLGRIGLFSGYRNIGLGLVTQYLVYSHLGLSLSSYTIPVALRVYDKSDKESYWAIYSEFGKANFRSGVDDVILLGFERGWKTTTNLTTVDVSIITGVVHFNSFIPITSAYLALNLRFGLTL
jgi:hypothetical protein